MNGAKVVLWVALGGMIGSAQSLSFEIYRERVEPIFLKKRPNHARCVACHEASASNFKLQPLEPGATAWTESQSRLNFESVSHLVVPGDPAKSRLLNHPLAPEAGGDDFHGGGHQFESKDDPDWKVIEAWVREAR
ncbi:MAG TPA: hypothetical protein VGG72_11755 [Bryobacteraceae bacterium]|jgi:hypothetical protein